MSSLLHGMGPASDLLQNKRAVIDIGSNSVRLVIYGGPWRTPLPVFNEKVMCGLGAVDPETGALKEDAIQTALVVLKRFRFVLDAHGDVPVTVFATAATRSAVNGEDFVDRIKTLGLEPRILSGEEEAYFAACGVLSGIPDAINRESGKAAGLCGDLGGGSLELTRFSSRKEGPFANYTSLPLGALYLLERFGPNPEDAKSFVDKHLSRQEWVKEKKMQTLYAVGGAWRAIAKIHMAQSEYPLPILHQYQISAREMLDLCLLLQNQSAASLSLMPGVQRKRIATLPHAAMVLTRVLKASGVKRVVVSSGGVREGILYDQLDRSIQSQDPLETLAEQFSRRFCPSADYSRAVYAFTEGVIQNETEYERRIRSVACKLCDVAVMYHPDMRAEHASSILLNLPYVGIDHAGRIALALALYQRHRGKPSARSSGIPGGVASEDLEFKAITLGLTLRFASDFSSGQAIALSDCVLGIDEGVLTFKVPARRAGLIGETPRKRLDTLADHLGKKAQVEII